MVKMNAQLVSVGRSLLYVVSVQSLPSAKLSIFARVSKSFLLAQNRIFHFERELNRLSNVKLKLLKKRWISLVRHVFATLHNLYIW